MRYIPEDKWFDKGCELLAQKSYQKAVKMFEKSVKKDPHNELAWYKQGIAFTGYGKLSDSVHCFEKALAINPDNELALLQKANSVERLGNLEEANELFGMFINKSHDDVRIINTTKRKILNTKRLEKRGIKTLPQSKYEMAMQYVVDGEYEGALLIFESLITKDPEKLYLLYPYAVSLLETQKYKEALEITKRLVAKDKKNCEVLMLQGKIYHMMRNYQKAVKTYEQARLINETEGVRSALREVKNDIYDRQREKKKDLEARCLKGRLCLASQEFKEGRKYFQEIIKEDPSYDDAWLFQGLSFLLEKNFEAAVESFNRTLELQPKSSRALMMLGGALYFLQKYDEALEQFSTILERSPDYKEAKEFKELVVKAKNGEVNELILTRIFYLFAASFRYSELTGKFLRSSKRDHPSNVVFFEDKDLLEICDIICELEQTYNHPKNVGYFDFFMLMKNLYDAISFYKFKNGPLSRVAEFYLFVLGYFEFKASFNSERLHDRINRILRVIGGILKKEKILDTIDRLKAMQTLPVVEEKDKTEQHLKSVSWRLAGVTNISLRTDISINHEVIQSQIRLLNITRRGIYGPEGIEGIRRSFIQFKEQMEILSQKYKDVSDFGITPILMDMPYTFGEISKVLNI